MTWRPVFVWSVFIFGSLFAGYKILMSISRVAEIAGEDEHEVALGEMTPQDVKRVGCRNRRP